MFWVKKATAATVALFAMFAFGVGVGVSTHQLAPTVSGQEGSPSDPTSSLYDASPTNLANTETILSRLEEQLQKAEQEYKLAMEKVKRARKALNNRHSA